MESQQFSDGPAGAEQLVRVAVAALAGTAGLESLPVAEHVNRFEAVHGALADALSAIDGE